MVVMGRKERAFAPLPPVTLADLVPRTADFRVSTTDPDAANNKRLIKTRSGSLLEFDDTDGDGCPRCAVAVDLKLLAHVIERHRHGRNFVGSKSAIALWKWRPRKHVAALCWAGGNSVLAFRWLPARLMEYFVMKTLLTKRSACLSNVRLITQFHSLC